MRLTSSAWNAASYALRDQEIIQAAHRRASHGHVHEFMVLELDLSDPQGRAIAEASGLHEPIIQHMRAAELEEVPPVLLWCLPVPMARQVVGDVNPKAAAALKVLPPPGYFLVLAAFDGGVAILGMPHASSGPQMGCDN
jgi:hypothetical protein